VIKIIINNNNNQKGTRSVSECCQTSSAIEFSTPDNVQHGKLPKRQDSLKTDSQQATTNH